MILVGRKYVLGGNALGVDVLSIYEDTTTWYWKFNNTSYGNLNSELTLEGDFEITCETKNLENSSSIIGDSQNANSVLKINGTGRVYARTSTGNSFYSDENLVDSTLSNSIKLSRRGTAAEIYLNGVVVATSNSFGGDILIDYIGRYAHQSNDFAKGYIYNLNITGISNQSYTELSIPLNEVYTDDHLLLDSNGNTIGVKVNDLESDYTTTI